MSGKNVFANVNKDARLSRVDETKKKNPQLFKGELVGFTVRVPAPMLRRLKVLAAQEGSTVQGLTAEGLALLFEERANNTASKKADL